MENNYWDSYIELLKEEVIPALGCTEPIAVAFAAAKAKELLKKKPERVEVIVSRNILKNAMGVGIPGTGMIGLDIATALGTVGGNASAGLEVLKYTDSEDIEAAKLMLEEDRVSISYSDKSDILYVEVVMSAENNTSRVVIENSHTNIILEEVNDEVIFQKQPETETDKENIGDEYKIQMTVREIYDFALNVPVEKIEFILESVKLNNAISMEGLTHNYGLKIGKTIEKNINRGIFSRDIITEAVKRTAAATDARMAGSMLPVMSNSGSGNQGIVATMPVVATAEMIGSDKNKTIRALVLSHLITIHCKSQLHRLNPLCGAVVAAIGSGCGITYLMGGDYKNIEYSIFNMIGNISGMICDGAKNSCSLKAGACVNAAVQAAILAIENVGVTEKEGIVDGDVEKTIENLGRLSNVGMAATDGVIIDIMLSKDKHQTSNGV